MASIKVNRLTNANVYLDGGSLLGQVEEANLPDVKHMMSDHKALGMIGKMEMWSGIDKMETKLKWNSFYPEALVKTANPFRYLRVQVRSSLEIYDATGRIAEHPVVVHLVLAPKNHPGGNFKQHDNVEAETNFNTVYMKQVINGQTIVEIDVLANIFKVDGVDIMAQYRANLGI